MTEDNRFYDVQWQKINTQFCENEKKIRMKWFIQNRQRLLDNLNEDHAGDVVRNKLKQLKEYHEQWKINEPEIKSSREEKKPSLSKEKVETNYMYPVDPSILKILYETGSENIEARKNYLKKRHELKPEDRFYSAECTNWEYGWRLKDFPRVPPVKAGRKLIIQDSFYRKNSSSLNRDPDLSQKIQATHLKSYDDSFKIPRWYQELSIPQMQQILALKEILRCDYQEQVSERSQKVLRDLGITSTFVKISSKKIKNIHKLSQLDSARFLSEIYWYITGNYFEEEGYKKIYDCNERLVLSAIAFLKLPETINELHRRLPVKNDVKLPRKPSFPKVSIQKPAKSPYLELLPERPDWRSYRTELHKWREKCNLLIRPRIILPPTYLLKNDENSFKNDQSVLITTLAPKKKYSKQKSRYSKKNLDKKSQLLVAKIDEESTEVNEDKNEEENYEIDKKKVEEGNDNFEEQKNNENIDLTYNLNVFENFVSKKYLPGRENLSRQWQERLEIIDDEYKKLEKVANCMLQKVREVSKNIYNPDMCNNCCACKQSYNFSIKKHLSKVPHLLLDSITDNENDQEQVIGSIVFNSPPESLPESWTNLPQIIPSQDKVIRKKLISNITIDEKGKTHYVISTVIKDNLHIPKKIRTLDVPVKNVPPCSCNQSEFCDEEDEKKICLENEICIATKYRSSKFLDCKKCSDDISVNKIFRDFEKIFRERETIEKEIFKPINHETCTQRFFREEKNDTKEETRNSEEPKMHYLINVLKKIDEKKMLNRPKVSKKSDIKDYKDNIRFAVNGVMEHFDMNNSQHNNNNNFSKEKYILSEVIMQTPITITPESSESSLSDISLNRPHHHWSITEFTPKPKPIESKPFIKTRPRFNVDQWRAIINEPFKKEVEELFQKAREFNLSQQPLDDYGMENSIEKDDKSETKHTQEQKKTRRESNVRKNKKNYVIEKKKKATIQKELQKIEVLSNNNKEEIDDKEENFSDFGQKSSVNLMKIALKQMAKEGFLLAKLPVCYNIPQLQMWVMYRDGFIFTEKQKFDLLEKSTKMWNLRELKIPDKIAAPVIAKKDKTNQVFHYDDMKKLQSEVEYQKKIFHSTVRKFRVNESRKLWNQMEFEKFPSLAFKQAYFIYQPSKEADGYLKRPYGFNPSS